ncbi:hypothetical protein M23134_02615 [Microscilla marina ATCC 23134]|uniref:Uncharacterized protein n=1 Tax=Microscilla marina ATCC 23134 TaxID=313606 RepID=A1ZNQ7_MICM2|nr:hypothetical protein M23134_02615 [Microscilla marina ATCC 23134]
MLYFFWRLFSHAEFEDNLTMVKVFKYGLREFYVQILY